MMRNWINIITESQTTAAHSVDEDYWYDHRHELQSDDMFEMHDGSIVKLDRQVPGDATQWYVADWSSGSFGYYDRIIEPGDLKERITDPSHITEQLVEDEAKTFTPNAAMAKAAELGLKLRKEFKRGGTEVGVRRANQLAARRPVSEADMKAIYSYFKRHAVDKQGKSGEWGSQTNPSNGYIAWLLWGGDAGQKWANSMRPKLDEFQMKDVDHMITTGGDEPPMPPVEDEDGGDGDRPEMVRVEGICWYEDNEDQDEVYSDDLPTEVTIPVFADPNDEGSQMMLITIEGELIQRYGHKHNAVPMFFEYKFI